MQTSFEEIKSEQISVLRKMKTFQKSKNHVVKMI